MKKLVIKSEYPQKYPDDVARMTRVCAERGYFLDELTAAQAWRKFSEDYYCAGWLRLPGNDDDLFDSLMRVLEEQES